MRPMVLTTILVVQLILVAAVWWVRLDDEEFEPESLLSFEPRSVQKVEISASDDERRVTLVRNADDWQLASGVPADVDKVEQFLASWRTRTVAGPWPSRIRRPSVSKSRRNTTNATSFFPMPIMSWWTLSRNVAGLSKGARAAALGRACL
ncbi:MAG: hypothetical protein CM1200mP9_06850 [Gammaproteobacteria bacterium]|nr:MAG: hypothetical protein CM1200mP9_06850 [Gammaproteobacteria bacterium]